MNDTKPELASPIVKSVAYLPSFVSFWLCSRNCAQLSGGFDGSNPAAWYRSWFHMKIAMLVSIGIPYCLPRKLNVLRDGSVRLASSVGLNVPVISSISVRPYLAFMASQLISTSAEESCDATKTAYLAST